MSLYAKVVVALAILLVATSAGSVFLFLRVWKQEGRGRSFVINALLTIFSLAFVLFALEVYFYRFDIVPEGFRVTLASQHWFALYGGPTNSLGYRDDEHRPEDFQGKRSLLVVGDSFARGSGIPDYHDMFSQVLSRKLGEGWEIANIGVAGWDTISELREIKAYPVRTDTVILQYYINDIIHAASTHKLPTAPPIPTPPAKFKPLIGNSYLVNKIFWSIYRAKLRLMDSAFRDMMLSAYENPQAWTTHVQELQAFVDYVKSLKARLIVLIIPNLFNVEQSAQATSRVSAFLARNNVEVVDLTPLVMNRDPKTMVVNPLNAHANEALNREIADILYQQLLKTRP